MTQENQPLDLTKFEQVNIISESNFSKKIKIIDKTTYKTYFAKIFNKILDKTKTKTIDKLTKEAQTIISLSHPSVIKTIGYSLQDFRAKDRFVVISEFNKNGSLSNILKLERTNKQPSTWNDTKKLINVYGIASGMSYLHKQGIIHTNLNLDSILETKNFYPKINNFGFLHFSRKIENSDINLTNAQDKNIIYIAPEITEEGIYDSSCDVYSFGVILYNIFTDPRKKEKIKNSFAFLNIVHNHPEKLFDDSILPKCYTKLILRCLSMNRRNRPTFDEIIHILKDDQNFILDSMNKKEFDEYVNYIETRKSNPIDETENEEEDDGGDDYTEKVLKNKSVPILLDVEKVDLIKFEKKERIGGGGFGDVYKINEIKTGFYFAAKVSKEIISENEKSDSLGINLKNEVNILSNFKHPSLLKFIGFSSIDFSNELKPTIVTEYLKNGSLEKLLKNERNGNDSYFESFWNDTMRLVNIYGIALSMLFLHSRNILHRDLKPENVIFDDFLFPKLSDFGISVELEGDVFNDDEAIGTRVFMSPEIYIKNIYSKSSDVYAFGVLVYEIMSKKYPFEEFPEVTDPNKFMYSLCFKNIRPKISEKVPKRYKKLIQSCWSKSPEKRPTFEKIVYDLRNDSEFITEDVDEEMFKKYIDFIEKKKGNKKLIDSSFSFHSMNLLLIYKELQQNIETLLSESSSYLDNYEVFDEYQTTCTSSVFRIKDRMTGKAFSAKIAHFNIDQYSPEEVANIKKEVKKLTKLKHPSIQQFFDYSFVDFEKQPRPVVITEFNSSMTLYDVIQNERKGKANPNWNDTKKLINIYGIASAMNYLHSNDILHPSLSLKSIFVDDSLCPKLSDIGFFTQVENSKFATNVTTKKMGINAYSMSPEFLKSGKKSKSSDVYTYSYIAYEILTSEVPFKDIKNVKDLYEEIINKKYRPSFNKKTQGIYKNLISLCWSDDPNDRPSFDDITNYLEKNIYSVTNIDKKKFSDYIKHIKKTILK